MVDINAYTEAGSAYANTAYLEAYRYLYDLAEQLGTSYEALVISLGIAILLSVLLLRRQWKRRKEKIIREKLLSARYPAKEMYKAVPEAEGDFEERVWLKFPADRVKVELDGDNLIIKIYEPKGKAETRQGSLEVELPKDINSAMVSISRKYSLASITLVNADGLLIESTSETPGEDAARAMSRISSMDISKGSVTRSEISDTEAVFAIPYKETHVIALVKSKAKLEGTEIERDLAVAVSLL